MDKPLIIDPDRPQTPEAPEGMRVISASDIITRLNEASAKMSVTNPNKTLVLDAAYAIRQLVDRLAFHEEKSGRPH